MPPDCPIYRALLPITFSRFRRGPSRSATLPIARGGSAARAGCRRAPARGLSRPRDTKSSSSFARNHRVADFRPAYNTSRPGSCATRHAIKYGRSAPRGLKTVGRITASMPKDVGYVAGAGAPRAVRSGQGTGPPAMGCEGHNSPLFHPLPRCPKPASMQTACHFAMVARELRPL